MNILFTELSLPPYNGGIERVTNTLAKNLSTHDINIFYSYFDIDDKSISDELKLKLSYDMTYDFLKKIYSDFLIKNKIEIIINQDLNFPILTSLYKELKYTCPSVNIIDCIHNAPDFYRYQPSTLKHKIKDRLYRCIKGYSIDSKLWRDMYDVVDTCILLSRSFLPIAKKEYGKNRLDKMKIIANPLSFELEQNIDFTTKKKQFLIVTRFYEQQKNIKAALRIWKRFEKYNNEYILKIAGYGKDENMIVDYIRQLGLRNIEFVGKVENPQYLYKESRFFLLTSKYEGFGMTLVEAQQYGCIPFAFNSYPAVYDIIEDNRNGFIINAFNERQYYRKMLRVCSFDDSRLKEISYNAHISCEKFDVGNIVNKWLCLFEQIKHPSTK